MGQGAGALPGISPLGSSPRRAGTPGAALRSRGGADVPGPGRVVPAGRCRIAAPHTHPRRGGARPGPAVPAELVPVFLSSSGGCSARGLRGKGGQCGHRAPRVHGVLCQPLPDWGYLPTSAERSARRRGAPLFPIHPPWGGLASCSNGKGTVCSASGRQALC